MTTRAMPPGITVLLVEDNPADARLVQEMLRDADRGPVRLTHVPQLHLAVAALQGDGFDVVLLDLNLPDSTGLDTFQRIALVASRTPVVVLTGVADEELALHAVSAGAQDYLVKGRASGELLFTSLRYAIERRRIADSLRDSEEQYRAVTETAQDAILTVADDGRILFANPAADHAFGYDRGELVGRLLTELMPERYRARHEAGWRRYLATGQRTLDWRRVEFVARRRDGKEFPVEISYAETIVAGTHRWTAVLRDVTERTRAHQALTQSEERYRTLFDGSPVGMYRTLPDGTFVDANPALVRMLGYPDRDALLHTRVQDLLVHPERRGQWEDALRTAGSLTDVVLEVRRQDGAVLIVEDRARVVSDEQGRLLFYEGALTDVTEARRAQQALRDTQESYRLLLDSSGEGIYGIDTKGRCTFCSARALAMLGFATETDVLGNDMHELVHARRRDGSPYSRDDCPITQAFERGTPVHVTDDVFWRADGTPLPVEYRSQPLLRAGRLAGAVVTFSDVTGERQLEEQLRQAQKMEAVGQLAGGIAHDFNNLLTVVLSESDLALSELASDAPGRVALEEIRHAGERAAVLTRQLLTFSRKQLTAPTVFELNDLVNGVFKLVARLISEDVEIITQLTAEPTTVRADQGQLEQVLINLVVNARDAMPTGGQLRIETRAMDAKDAPAEHPELNPAPHAVLLVSDTGTGITDEVRQHLFEPFFTTKQPGKGTGLGLATSYGIVKECGGRIGVYSELGLGTTMKVYLPLVSDVATPKSAPLAGIPRGDETVLLVEDDERVRRTTARTLAGLGYRTLEARSGTEALTLIAETTETIDLLLTDVVLPGMGGRVVADRVKALRPGIKILFASGYSDDVILQHRLIEQGVPFIQKPFSTSSLARRIREVLER